MTVSAPGLTTAALGTARVQPGSSQTVTIPANVVLQGSGVSSNVVRALGSASMSTFATVQGLPGCGATIVHPITALKQEYLIVTYQPSPGTRADNSVILVAAAETGSTDVQFFFSPLTGRISIGGSEYDYQRSYRVTLAANQVVQVRGSNSADLTGTRIMASQKVAVYSGNIYTTVGVSGPTAGPDTLVEQMPGTTTLGRNHIIAAVPGASAGIKIKVVSDDIFFIYL